MTKLKRDIKFYPAWSRRDPNPAKDYGIHGVDVYFTVTGPAGAVVFFIMTNWYLNDDEGKFHGDFILPPSAGSLTVHSRKPRYKGHEPVQNCPHLKGNPCYQAGSFHDGDKLYDVLRHDGSDGVWEKLEQHYADVFGKEK